MLSTRMTFAHLKQVVSIASVLAAKGMIHHFKKKGDHLCGPCPVHGGDNPNAFVVSLSKNLWYCFTRCQTGGDVVQLVRLLEKSSYAQTAQYLASLANAPTSPERIAHHTGGPFRPFTKYLTLDHTTPWLQQKGIHPQTARLFESGAYHGPGFLVECIAVRLHDLYGNPLGYAGRRINDHQALQSGKWKFPRGFPKNGTLYNIHRIDLTTTKSLTVVECPWGVMRLHQLNIPSVALLGVHISPFQYDLLTKFPCIILMLDGDQAGKAAMDRLQKILSTKTDVRHAMLPQGKDPDDLNDDLLMQMVR